MAPPASRFSLVVAYRDRIWKCRGRRGCVETGINIEDNFPRVLSLWILRKTDITLPVRLSVKFQ